MTWGAQRPRMAPGWGRLRAAVLAEEPRCRYCGAPSTEVDHLTPRARGGGDERTNLAGVCGPCHRTKTASRDSKPSASKTRPAERHPGEVA